MCSTARPGPVLLGLRDVAIEAGSRCSWETSKVGGRPDCVPGITMQYPHCPRCSDPLIQVVQVYCPLEGSAYHRTINVLACLRPECCGRSDSWKVLRSECLGTPPNQETTAKKMVPVPVTVKDWCPEADDWGMEEPWGSSTEGVVQTPAPDSEREVMEQTSRLEALLLEGAEGQGLVSQSTVPEFQPFYISVMEEEDSHSQSSFKHEEELLAEYQRREGVCVEQLPLSSCDGEGAPETYEKSQVQHGDRMFNKFMKRISSCPQQILRYCWNGSPLLLSPLRMESAASVCELCTSPRVFEFQLMPALVNMLKGSSSQEQSVEFGTVLIYTCQRSCWSPTNQTPVEESAFVQADPDQHFFNRH
ncbi:programmed cell death protein 2-like isoform X1 [Hemiscyllium ocellatum]|uniref:programmed cell death protein 2-like isoform X1 n=2 Tax=Hemiscyllium ocellatum TaxID=170820 RepID=UPI002965D084|nr:programmed cell death protein 2-like isoform X1 [Hemiscyllium ocellatum]